MWPFFKNASAPEPNGEHRRKQMKFEEIVQGLGDYRDLGTHDASVKFWLPAPAKAALDEISALNGDSTSEALRQLFAIHCYGQYAFTVMTKSVPQLFKESEVRYSRAKAQPEYERKRITTYWVPELGKNVAPIKVWLPRRMRENLQQLADHVGISLSQYLREIVISRVLGHGTLPKRPEMLAAFPTPDCENWCNDREVSLRQATYEEYCASGAGECRTDYEDEASGAA